VWGEPDLEHAAELMQQVAARRLAMAAGVAVEGGDAVLRGLHWQVALSLREQQPPPEVAPVRACYEVIEPCVISLP